MMTHWTIIHSRLVLSLFAKKRPRLKRFMARSCSTWSDMAKARDKLIKPAITPLLLLMMPSDRSPFQAIDIYIDN